MRNLRSLWVAVLLAAVVLGGCTTAAPDYEYITGVDIIGDRSVKYLYLPGESSMAGDSYHDQAIAVEICSLEEEGGRLVERDCELSRLLKTEEYR